MVYLMMFVKTIAWVTAFWLGIRRGWKEMLLWVAGSAIVLTAADNFLKIETVSVVLLTFILYALMSLFLMSIAWKLHNPAVSLACHIAGTYGAFAVVSLTIEYFRWSML